MRIIPENCLEDQRNGFHRKILRVFLTLGLSGILYQNINFRKGYGILLDSALFATTKEGNVTTAIINDNNSIRATSNYGYETRATSSYSWVGNHWYPPQGVPEFLVQQIIDLFRAENTLWIGDSTSRQDYNTMYSIVNSVDIYNVPAKKLNKDINKGKKTTKGQQPSNRFHCEARRSANANSILTDAGQVVGTGPICTTGSPSDLDRIGTSPGISSNMNDTGKFDLVGNVTCFHLDDNAFLNLFQNYSVVIFSQGIWEVRRPWDCAIGNPQMAPEEKLVKGLNALHKLSNPNLFIIWKNHGPSAEGEASTKSKNLNDAAEAWFLEKNPMYMDLVDFGGAVMRGNRSYGGDRIRGDLPAHWGLDARLLSIQMVSHALYLKQNREHRS